MAVKHDNAEHTDIGWETYPQGVNLKDYFAWSRVDSFAWAEGYSKRFGLYYVDFDSQQCVAKSSAKACQGFLKCRK